MKQMNFVRWANLILSSIALVMISLVAMALFFGWQWNIVFISIIGITVGSYLIVESKIKNFTSLVKKQSFKFRNILHTLSFGFGMVAVVLSVVMLILGRVPELVGLVGWFYIIIGLLSISEVVENLI